MTDAALPLDQIHRSIPAEQAPLKYYLLHPLLYLGRDEFLLRFPALFFDLASMVLLYLLGRALFDRKTALLACFFMAVSMWHIHYATSARNYPLYAFSAILSTLCLYRAAEGGKIRDWIFYGLSLAFSFYSFYPSLFVLAAQLGWFFIYHGRQRAQVKRLALSLGLFLLLGIPAILSSFEIMNSLRFERNLGFRGLKLLAALRDHFGGTSAPYAPGLIVFFLSFISAFFYQKKQAQAALLLALVLFPAIFYVMGVDWLLIKAEPRHFLHLYPFFLLLSAAGIVSWRSWVAKLVGIAVFLSPLCLHILSHAGFIKKPCTPYAYLRNEAGFKEMAYLVKKNSSAFDFIVAEDAPTILGFQYYLDKKNENPVLEFRKNSDKDLFYVYKSGRVPMYGLDGDLESLRFLAKTGRLGVIDLNGNMTDENFENGNMIMAWLKNNSYRAESERRGVLYFINPPGSSPEGGFETSSAEAHRRLVAGAQVVRRLTYPFNGRDVQVDKKEGF